MAEGEHLAWDTYPSCREPWHVEDSHLRPTPPPPCPRAENYPFCLLKFYQNLQSPAQKLPVHQAFLTPSVPAQVCLSGIQTSVPASQPLSCSSGQPS